ncbi:MAG: glycosyltransferase family 39 protein, partial [Candidatus Hydrogenedentota bacterium]
PKTAKRRNLPAPAWQVWLTASLPVLMLLPFLDKAFHIDDTVYLRVAQQIQHHPFDFFGFDMNRGTQSVPVSLFNKNPPLFSYFLVPFGMLFGWNEWAMHGAQLIPTAFAAVGILRLAERMCATPLLASLIAVLTPAFLVSTSVVMCEPLMLALYVWSIVFWIDGTEKNHGSPYSSAQA